MNKQTGLHEKKADPANPLLNAAILATVALTILPAAIFGAVRILHPQADASAKAVEVEETTPKRSSVAERRAQRLEARKAKEAKAQTIYPEITMEKVEPYYDDFGMDYDPSLEFNGFGMMPSPYMAAPGMMPAPNRSNFNGGGRMPNAENNFNNRFGRGRGNF